VHEHSGIYRRLIMYSPLLICLAVMAPRLASPQFGLFDDGITITKAQEILSGVWDPSQDIGAGRFRPAYWLYHALIYAMAGQSALGFFIGNLFLYTGITSSLIYLIWRWTHNERQAWVTGVLFALSSPTIENFYTISKVEHLQILAILFSLILLLPIGEQKSVWKMGAAFLLSTITVGIAILGKETALVLPAIGLAWFVLAYLRHRSNPNVPAVRVRGAFFFATTLAGLVYLGLRNHYVGAGLADEGYTSLYNLGLQTLFSSAIQWFGWLMRDFLYIIPLTIILLIWSLKIRKLPQNPLYLDSFIWMGGWIGVLLPWSFAVEYLILPFTVGAVAFAGLILREVLDAFGRMERPGKMWAAVGLGLSAILVILTVFNNFTNARLQLTMDQMNAKMVAFVGDAAPAEGQVFVNLPAESEYIDEIHLHIREIHNRPDIMVAHLPQASEAVRQGGYLLLTPEMENKPTLSVRMGVNDELTRRANNALESVLDPTSQPVFEVEAGFRLINIDFPRLLCPFFGNLNYCATPRPIIDTRPFLYRWKVYAIEG
jgi:hypothetical protein